MEQGPELLIPRGLITKFQALAKVARIIPTFISDVAWNDVPLAPVADFGIVPREYQAEIIDLLVEKRQGYVVLPCGGGKTTTGALALLRTRQAGIVLVPTVDLMTQWGDTFARALRGDRSRIRYIGGGLGDDLRPLRPGEVAICVVSALYDLVRASAAAGVRFLRSAGVLLADEAHHLAAEMWSYLTERCPARWRWGLTATPERGDGWTFILGVLLGPKLYELPATTLIDLGYLHRPTIVPVRSKWKPGAKDYWWMVRCPTCKLPTKTTWGAWQEEELVCAQMRDTKGPKGGKVRERCGTPLPPSTRATKDRLNWSTAVTNLSEDEERQALLVDLVIAAVDAERLALLLIGRKSVIGDLVSGIRTGGAQAEGVSSGAAGRDAKIASLRRGTIDVLVATQLADEGLDVPALDCVVMGNPGRDKGRAQQRSGRACRPEGLPPIIYDVVDDSPEFEAQWAARARAYREAYGRACVVSNDPMPLLEAVKHLARLAS